MVIGGASDAKPSMPLHASGRPTAIRELIVLRAVPLAHPSSAASSRCPTSHITTASAAPIASSILGGSESGQLSSVSRALQNSAMMQEAFGSPGGLHCSPAGSRPTTTRASPSNGSREMPTAHACSSREPHGLPFSSSSERLKARERLMHETSQAILQVSLVLGPQSPRLWMLTCALAPTLWCVVGIFRLWLGYRPPDCPSCADVPRCNGLRGSSAKRSTSKDNMLTANAALTSKAPTFLGCHCRNVMG